MSVSVMSASEAGPQTSSTVSTIAGDLYSLFLAPNSQSNALPAPLVPSSASPSQAAPATAAAKKPLPNTMPTGCAIKGVTPTAFVIAGMDGDTDRLATAVDATIPMAKVAAAHGNRIHYVFVSGTNGNKRLIENLMDFAVHGLHGAKPADVHFILGPKELQMLQNVVEGSGGIELAYLKRAKYIECIGPPDMDANGSHGMWIKYSSTRGGSIVGKVPDVGTQWANSPSKLSLIEWKDAINKRWFEMTSTASSLSKEQRMEYSFWLAMSQIEKEDAAPLPAQGLGTETHNSFAVFARDSTQAFGSVGRTLLVDKSSSSRFPAQTWVELGATSPSLYWLSSTWCQSTSKAFGRANKMVLNRSHPIDELQYYVSCTLGSLVQHAEQTDALAQPVYAWRNFASMLGCIGPCVRAGRDGSEILRVIQWTHESAPDVLMMLPESYVRYMLESYFQDTMGLTRLAGTAVSGELVLFESDIIQMKLCDLSEAEQLHAAQQLGPRIWKMSASESKTGKRVYKTYTSTADPLAGLRVKWVFAPGFDAAGARDMPTLVAQNSLYETVV